MLRRLLLAFGFVLLSATSSFGQSTTVSGTITDAGAQAWKNGTYSFVFTPNPAYGPVTYTWTGGTLTTTISGALSATGTYSVSIPSNSAISPVNSTWTATFCPQATSPCFNVNSVTITGATQTLNATPPTILINLQSAIPPVLAYSTTEVTGAVIGSQFYLLGTGQQVCSAVSGNNCTSWGSAGGITSVSSLPATCTPGTSPPVQITGSITIGTMTFAGGTVFYCESTNHYSPVSQGSGAAPIMGFYLSPQCPPSNAAQCFNTPADTVVFNDCNWSNVAVDVNCTASHFTAADVGKSAMGGQSCAGDNQGSGSSGQISTSANVTIASFISGTHITLSATPGLNVASNGCFIYGHLDDAGASAVDTALQAAVTCPKLFLAAANYFFASPHFFINPTACANIGPGIIQSAGTTTLPAGFEIEGRGAGNTAIYLNTNFPNGDGCTHRGATGQNNGGCFAIPVMGKWSDFRIDGGAQHNASPPGNLISMAVGTLQNFTCINYAWLNTGVGGINLGFISQLRQVNNAGCGGIGFRVETSASNVNMYNTVVENSTKNAMLFESPSAADVNCHWCSFSVQNNSANFQSVQNNGGKLRMFSGTLSSGNLASTTSVGQCYKDSGAGTFIADGVLIVCNFGGAGNANGAIWVAAAGGRVMLTNGTDFRGQSAGFAYADTAGGTLYMDSSVTFNQPFSNGNIVGQVIADGHSLTGACTGVATASQTLGLYGTGPNVTATTCTSANIGTGIPANQNRTLSNLRCTSSATTVSVACAILVNGSPSTLTCTMTAATSCNDFTHTVAVNTGDLISERIVTGAAETGANIKMFVLWQ